MGECKKMGHLLEIILKRPYFYVDFKDHPEHLDLTGILFSYISVILN
jgi:hypothetical protein